MVAGKRNGNHRPSSNDWRCDGILLWQRSIL
nr:MAG TPA: hypothetical protein [Caudoviricetes sp.]